MRRFLEHGCVRPLVVADRNARLFERGCVPWFVICDGEPVLFEDGCDRRISVDFAGDDVR